MTLAKRVPNTFQTILEGGNRQDIERDQARRAEIESHIGRYMSRWAHLEFTLGMATAAWLDSDDRTESQHFMVNQATSYKIDRFKEVLPKNWKHGQLLIHALYQGNAYRDSLAHWTLAIGGSNAEKAYGWSFWKMDKGVRVLEIDDTLMAERELKARILNEAVSVVMGEPFLLPDHSHTGTTESLAPAILNLPGTWATHEEFREHGRAVKKMFPEVHAQGVPRIPEKVASISPRRSDVKHGLGRSATV
ncbi:MAG: hypothetical protein JWM55_601 [Acidimicrobiaceae bacterium]|nr:hypothetical protein [Acidimicrobiaceae bacterium]